MWRESFVFALTGILFATVLVAGLLFVGCDDSGPLMEAPPPPDAGCIRNTAPDRYDIFLVVDVSGSMAPFLRNLRDEVIAVAQGLKDNEESGSTSTVTYSLIAYVNDVKVYGSKLRTIPELQTALNEAIERGQTGQNLTTPTLNSEEEENLLDALAEVPKLVTTDTQAVLVFVAGDAPFKEHPAVLPPVLVHSTFVEVKTKLEASHARIHAFVPDDLDGVSRNYGLTPGLQTLPGSTVHSIRTLTSTKAKDDIRDTLFTIAKEARCN